MRIGSGVRVPLALLSCGHEVARTYTSDGRLKGQLWNFKPEGKLSDFGRPNELDSKLESWVEPI
jgi:hypothetical protein